jgi:hypothetical protein
MVARMSRIPTTVQVLPDGTMRQTQSRGIAVPNEQIHDEQTNRLQAAQQRAVQAMRAHPHGDGLVVLRDLVIGANGQLTLKHGLHRAYRGWQPVRVRGNFARFQEIANADSALDAFQLNIKCDAACTFDLWVW